MGRIVNFGSLCIDTVLSVPHLVAPGETLRASGVVRLPGGKGLNQSLAAARAGAPVVHVGRVGEDGADLIALLADAGVDVAHIEVAPDAPTGHAMIQVAEDGQNAIVILAGANRGMPRALLTRTLDLLADGDWLLLQNETDWVPEAIAGAAATPARVALNLAPADAAARDWPLQGVDLFILNETEATQLTGELAPDAQLAALAERAPAALVALTFGGDGALLAPGPDCGLLADRIQVAAHPVAVVDTTGAGDAFVGALLAALVEGAPCGQALAQANAAGALACGRMGAAVAMPTRARIAALLAS